MADESTYGREPIEIIEIKQPRCGLRFGELPCRAAVAPEVLRENIALWSEQADNAYWFKVNASITADATAAPDGQTTADKLVENTATGFHDMRRTFTLPTSTQYALSIYAKAGGRTKLRIAIGTGAFATVTVDFDLSAVTVTNITSAPDSAGIEDVGNGWYRCNMVMTTIAAASSIFNFRLMAATGSYTGDGTSGLFLWGMQLEVGDGPSTYKRTTDAPAARIWGTDTQECYNTYWTCQDKESYDASGSLAWRFMRPRAGVYPLYEETGDDIKTNPLYMLTGVQTSPSRINIGARRNGESPLGVRATCTASFQDAPFDDHVGDYYRDNRAFIGGNFWAKLIARNPFQPEWEMRRYVGYAGQALGDMQESFYPVEKIEGPDSGGKVTVRGLDPLQLSDKRRAQFPRATDIKVFAACDASQTSIQVVATEADLTADFGNTGSRRFARIGSEIIEYTGYTGTAPEFTLIGVTRGALDTVASTHAVDDAVQRVGRYERMRNYLIAKDLIENHTTIGSGYIDAAQWDDEGGTFLALFTATTTIASPEDVEKLLGELCRDGLFNIWWDERQQTIPLLAVRPPQETPVELTDDLNVLKGSSEVKAEPDNRVTRVSVFFGVVNPLGQLTDPVNYSRRDINISGEYELPQATGGEIRELSIFSRWIRTDTQALLVGAQMLLRYKEIPRYLTVSLDAKDRAIKIGDVADVTTGTVTDVNGRAVSTRWQVISFHEVKPGDTVVLDMQSYVLRGRFAYIMDDATPDYSAASADERARGCFFSDDTGKMSDGTDGYKFQ